MLNKPVCKILKYDVYFQSPILRQDSFEEGKSAPIATPERSKSSSGETLEEIKEEIEIVKTTDENPLILDRENPCTTESSTTSSLPPTAGILTTTSRLVKVRRADAKVHIF